MKVRVRARVRVRVRNRVRVRVMADDCTENDHSISIGGRRCVK
jgi:hypothetical protein